MTKKPRKLSEVVETTVARQGSNDGKWFLMEHQLYEARFALQVARLQAELICDNPENDEDYELASSVLEMVSPVFIQMLGLLSSVKHLLTGTGVAERIGGQEDG